MSKRVEEFRVVGIEAAFGKRFVNDNAISLAEAQRTAEHFRDLGDRNVRVEGRVCGPWEELEDDDGDD